MEFLWKAISGIIHRQISSSIKFHDVLHGFCAGRGTGTATPKANLLQPLIDMRETVICSILLDMCKAYDDLDRYQCLDILTGYGVGLRTIRILRTYWVRIQMAAKEGGRYRPLFQSHRGVTQCYPLSPKIFNVVVDNVI